jgi:hypothetical protein
LLAAIGKVNPVARVAGVCVVLGVLWVIGSMMG